MAADRINDSYSRCLSELRARYKGRGVANNMAEKAALEAKSLQLESESYVLFDSRTGIADSYRSGVYNGSKYMTSDDFVRYFKSRRAFYMPEALRSKQEEATVQSVAPRHNVAVARGRRESSESDSKEGHLSRLISAIKGLRAEWLPIERERKSFEWRMPKLPVAAMSALAVFTVSLGLIVSGSVMIGSASGEIGRLNSEIAALEAQETDLEGKLDLKYSISQIEADAEALGMIKMEHADNQYISVATDDDVIVYDKEEDKSVGLAALLAAFGIELD